MQLSGELSTLCEQHGSGTFLFPGDGLKKALPLVMKDLA